MVDNSDGISGGWWILVGWLVGCFFVVVVDNSDGISGRGGGGGRFFVGWLVVGGRVWSWLIIVMVFQGGGGGDGLLVGCSRFWSCLMSFGSLPNDDVVDSVSLFSQSLLFSTLWTGYFGLLTTFSPSYLWMVMLRGLVGAGVSGLVQG